jgi:hypothetical protein
MSDFQLPQPVEVVTPQYLEGRLAAVTPTDIITREELMAQIAAIPPHTGPTQQDFTALTQTLTAALNQVAANVESKATQQDVTLAAAAVDAKFDMLRAAIREATDYDTLKARLLAVLE